MIETMQDNRVFLDYGPIQMVLDLSRGVERQPGMAQKVARFVVQEFKKLVPLVEEMQRKELFQGQKLPEVARIMIEASFLFPGEITPMGAVAGSFSEVAMEASLEMGADRVIINNGGDIALADMDKGVLSVGLPSHGKEDYLKIAVDTSRGIGGVCTSGLGGRSLTGGIASAAVVLAQRASVADACATYIGNCTDVESSDISRCLAEEVEAETDIPGHVVTLDVGSLTKKQICRALVNGLQSAEKLCQEGTIKGAVLQVCGEIAAYPDQLALEVKKVENRTAF